MSAATQGWNEQLLDLLEYRVVFGALVTTLDGLVVAQAGLSDEDAEFLAASAVAVAPALELSERGAVHARQGAEMRLIVVTERDAPQSELTDLLDERLARIEEALAA